MSHATSRSDLPDLGAQLLALLGKLPEEVRPRLLGRLEEAAADRYRAWAAETADRELARGLDACADREQAIAATVAQLFPERPEDKTAIEHILPGIIDGYRATLAARMLDDQFAMQAAAERRGAATWRAMAQRESEPARRERLLHCAKLEEDSAELLERTIAHAGKRSG